MVEPLDCFEFLPHSPSMPSHSCLSSTALPTRIMFSRQPLPATAAADVLRHALGASTPAAAETLQRALQSPGDVDNVVMDVQNGGKLAIGWVPAFRFQPRWSRHHHPALGRVDRVEGTKLHLTFDADKQKSPPMACTTTFWNALWPLPVPVLPPGISIDIKSHQLKGWMDLSTGEVQLMFDSDFGRSQAPLKVTSRMTTEPLSGRLFHAVGMRMQPDGQAKLVAVTEVPKTDDKVQNWLLKLPTDALSILNVRFDFIMKPTSSGSAAGEQSG